MHQWKEKGYSENYFSERQSKYLIEDLEYKDLEYLNNGSESSAACSSRPLITVSVVGDPGGHYRMIQISSNTARRESLPREVFSRNTQLVLDFQRKWRPPCCTRDM